MPNNISKILLLLCCILWFEPTSAQHVKFNRKNIDWGYKIKTGKKILVRTKDDPKYFYSKAILDSASSTHLYLRNPHNLSQVIAVKYDELVKIRRPRKGWHSALYFAGNAFMGFMLLIAIKEEPEALIGVLFYTSLINFTGPKRNFKTENFTIEYLPK